MAFALTLFVQAADRRVPPLASERKSSIPTDGCVCKHLYRTLCADVEGLSPPPHALPHDATSLYVAFSALFSHYEGDPLQGAVCARVLAFYFLTERSAGSVLSGWIQEHPETPQWVELHPAVIQAIATVQLHGSVLLREDAFRQTVTEIAAASFAE